MNDDWKNNVSTIAVLVYGVLSPYIAHYLSVDQFTTLVISIVSIVLVVWSAKNPNTLQCFGNGEDECDCDSEMVSNANDDDDDGGA